MSDKPIQHDEDTPLDVDAAVEEIRAVRRRLWEAADCDARRFVERSRQRAEERERKNRPGTKKVR